MNLLMIFLLNMTALLARTGEEVLHTNFHAEVEGQSLSGVLLMYRDHFRLTMAESEAACDGTTLYIWQESINEITITTPTQEEKEQVIDWLTENGSRVTLFNTIWSRPETLPEDAFLIQKEGAYINDMR